MAKEHRQGVGMCPATFCPLTAPNGSPWTGAFRASCQGSECPWFDMMCDQGGPFAEVIEASEREGAAFVLGPHAPKRGTGAPRSYDCPHAHECAWQLNAPEGELCPPRLALSLGLDARVANF